MATPRLKGETDKAYSAFREYCYMGAERSHEKLRVTLGKRQGYVGVFERWSSAHRWVERVAEYDVAHHIGVESRLIEEQVEDSKVRIGMVKAVRGRLAAVLKDIFDKEGAGILQTMSLRDAAQCLKLLNDEARKELGEEPAQRVELSGPGGGPIQTDGPDYVAKAKADLEKLKQELEADGIKGLTFEGDDR